jgi:hypothetical protein
MTDKDFMLDNPVEKMEERMKKVKKVKKQDAKNKKGGTNQSPEIDIRACQLQEQLAPETLSDACKKALKK